MSLSAPWASHYESPGPAVGAGGSRGSSGGSRGSSADGSHRPPLASARQGGGASNTAYPRDGVVSGARQETAGGSDGEWKRPRTLAPPWAAGGGQAKFLKRQRPSTFTT